MPLHDVNIMADFLQVVIPWLDRQPWVARYSPFMAEDFVKDGQLTRAGEVFVNTRG